MHSADPRRHHPDIAPTYPAPRVVEEQAVMSPDGYVTSYVLEECRDHYALVTRRGFGRDAVAAHRAFVARVAEALLPEMACVDGSDDDAPSWTPPAPAFVAEVRA